MKALIIALLFINFTATSSFAEDYLFLDSNLNGTSSVRVQKKTIVRIFNQELKRKGSSLVNFFEELKARPENKSITFNDEITIDDVVVVGKRYATNYSAQTSYNHYYYISLVAVTRHGTRPFNFLQTTVSNPLNSSKMELLIGGEMEVDIKWN